MFSSLLHLLWVCFQVLIGYNLILPLLFYFAYFLMRKKNPVQHISEVQPDYAVIVTAYEQTDNLPAVVNSLLQMNYSNFLVYVVADKCDISNLYFTNERVILLKPEETLGSNTRSHFYAITRFKKAHDYLTIIDSDNLVDKDYLLKLNTFFNRGFSAVQGIRKAKNLDTTYACLDAARDIYYHFYDGKVLFNIGSSATLSGSGMAFTVQLYKDCLEHVDVTGAGFDKVLQAAIVKKNYRIAFTDEAIVHDEKTSRSEQLIKQRARWINTWFRYAGFGFSILIKGIRNCSRNQFLFGFVLLRPPLFIFILLSLVCLFINFFVQPFASIVWAVGFMIFIAGFFIALLHSKTDKRIYRSLINIPRFVLLQIVSLIKARKANQYSVATKHYHDNSVEELNTH